MQTLTIKSPAKLNLFLHITGRRTDGYHTLQTVFQLLDYYDELQFTARTDDQINLRCIANSPFIDDTCLADLSTSNNLIIKAARSLREKAQISQGADIVLYKRIPMGGGLGGGSSNAATTLIALNRLWLLHLPISTLLKLGVKLGADVPVFLTGTNAWGEGIGEVLTPVNLPRSWFLVIVPDVSISTPEIYNDPQLTRDTDPITIQAFLQAVTQTRNDFEAVVKMRFPAIAEAIAWLGQFAPARLTGSGACVFASFDCRSQAEEVLEQLPTKWQGFVSAGMTSAMCEERYGV